MVMILKGCSFGDTLLGNSVGGGDGGENGKSILAMGLCLMRIHSCYVGWSCGDIGSCPLVRSICARIVVVIVWIPCDFVPGRSNAECRTCGAVCLIDSSFHLLDGESS